MFKQMIKCYFVARACDSRAYISGDMYANGILPLNAYAKQTKTTKIADKKYYKSLSKLTKATRLRIRSKRKRPKLCFIHGVGGKRPPCVRSCIRP